MLERRQTQSQPPQMLYESGECKRSCLDRGRSGISSTTSPARMLRRVRRWWFWSPSWRRSSWSPGRQRVVHLLTYIHLSSLSQSNITTNSCVVSIVRPVLDMIVMVTEPTFYIDLFLLNCVCLTLTPSSNYSQCVHIYLHLSSPPRRSI